MHFTCCLCQHKTCPRGLQNPTHPALVACGQPGREAWPVFFCPWGGGREGGAGEAEAEGGDKSELRSALEKKGICFFSTLGPRQRAHESLCFNSFQTMLVLREGKKADFKPCRLLGCCQLACVASSGGLPSNMTHPDVVGGFDQVIFARLGPVHFAHLL